MRRNVLAFVIVAALATGAAAAGSVSLAFNDQAFDAWGIFGGKEDGGLEFGGRYLYSDSDEDDASIPGALVGFSSTPTANDEMRFFVGALGFFGSAHNEDVSGVSVGGVVSWTPDRWKGVFASARVFFAPEVFCFGDTQGIFEWAGRGGYQVNEKFNVFLEYSKLSVDIDNSGDADAKIGLTLGASLSF